MLERLLSIIQVEFLALKHMLDVKLPVAAIISVVNDQVGVAEVGQTGNDSIAYFLPALL